MEGIWVCVKIGGPNKCGFTVGFPSNQVGKDAEPQKAQSYSQPQSHGTLGKLEGFHVGWVKTKPQKTAYFLVHVSIHQGLRHFGYSRF